MNLLNPQKVKAFQVKEGDKIEEGIVTKIDHMDGLVFTVENYDGRIEYVRKDYQENVKVERK